MVCLKLIFRCIFNHYNVIKMFSFCKSRYTCMEVKLLDEPNPRNLIRNLRLLHPTKVCIQFLFFFISMDHGRPLALVKNSTQIPKKRDLLGPGSSPWNAYLNNNSPIAQFATRLAFFFFKLRDMLLLKFTNVYHKNNGI